MDVCIPSDHFGQETLMSLYSFDDSFFLSFASRLQKSGKFTLFPISNTHNCYRRRRRRHHANEIIHSPNSQFYANSNIN